MRIKPTIKRALLTLLVIIFGVWIYVGVRLSVWTPIEYMRYVWLTQNVPVAYQLWHGEIKAGDDAEAIINHWQPHMLARYDSWVEMRWYPHHKPEDTNTISFIGMYLLAKDGKLVVGSSYADDGLCEKVFFDTLTPEEKSQNRKAIIAYADKLQAERAGVMTTNVNK